MSENNKRKEKVIAEESIVIKEILDNTLYTGLFGILDSTRIDTLTERMMDEIVLREADIIIMDLGGVVTVDTGIADRISRMILTAKMLGAVIILCGVTPEVAQTMVQSGVNISVEYNFRNMKSALKQAFLLKGIELVKVTEQVKPVLK